MSKTTAFETDFLELLFNNTTVSGIGSDGLRGSTTAGNLSVALFTADPGEAGSATNECTYTGYARETVARTSGGWTIAGDTCSNTAAVTFGECTAGSETATHFAICKSDTESTNDLILYAALDSSLAISSGIIPEFIAGAIDVTEQ
jgi:hypothetical protein